jgi:hypothetical protein
MAEIIAVFGILAISCIIVMLIKAYTDDDEQANNDYSFCYDCRCGWCNATPNDAECKKWKEKEAQDGK